MAGNTQPVSSPREVIRTLFSFLDAQGQGDYMGEAVSQLEHSLQAAALAVEHGADEPTILAALLHDVGRFIPEAKSLPPLIAPDGSTFGTEKHEEVGEVYLRKLGFPPAVYEVVGAHVWAKRYLCATEPAYWAALSKLSKITLELQGGTFTPGEVEVAARDPLLEAKLNVRRWDDQAKVAGKRVPGLQAYEDMAVRCLSG
ncbi:Metal-dependent phosphohydrolase, HD subdomain protein [Niveomyces insectorum RCEF 264]|uniref:Metal-dependent phosphohydrolase, HD subdomain protein n=1 Tax=Niveomyces insectorum RCEF 264 TaxID=1081102 RepID=A0A167YN10_9HYPO|nr:Metal-dependent phosphohydrolase, HD subdomain protein [Niveomyces insectorum RCEF 264]